MKTRIFFTTNAGLYFSSGRSEILIDGMHDAAAVGFSPMDEEMARQMKSESGLFAGEGTLLFTHLHKDHYNAAMVRQYLKKHPKTALWGPGLRAIAVHAHGDGDEDEIGSMTHLKCGDFSVTAYTTRHSGANFAHIPHRSYLLRTDSTNESFFVTGDAVLDPELAWSVRQKSAGSTNGIEVFVTAYQLIEKPSLKFLEALSPSHVYLIHQPQPEDEAYESVERLAEYAKRNLEGRMDIEEPQPMSWLR